MRYRKYVITESSEITATTLSNIDLVLLNFNVPCFLYKQNLASNDLLSQPLIM